MQELNTNITIKIPEEYVLVKRTEYNELLSLADPTWVSGLKWLSKQTGGMSPETLREKILYPHRNKLEEFVAYPDKPGQPWRFNIKCMKEWLNKNFKKVNR